MADAGIYPAIDVESSVSRAMGQFASDAQQQLAMRFRQVCAVYRDNKDLVSIGAYQAGGNPQLDEALSLWPSVIEYLRQHPGQSVNTEQSLQQLRELFEPKPAEPEAEP